MSSSLGYRRGHDHNADSQGPRAAPRAPTTTTMDIETSGRMSVFSLGKACVISSSPGPVLSTLLLSILALGVPLAYEYATIDYADNTSRGLIIGASALAVRLLTKRHSVETLFNVVLFFHIGIEILLLDVTIAYARTVGISDVEMGFAIAGGAIIIVHLLPFLVSDNLFVLVLLSAAGLMVNTAVAVFLDPQNLLLLIATSTSLLLSVYFAAGTPCSMFSLIRKAFAENSFLEC